MVAGRLRHSGARWQTDSALAEEETERIRATHNATLTHNAPLTHTLT